MPEQRILTGEFVARLLEAPEGGEETALKLARSRGWLEAQDVLAGGSPLLRNAAARILHEFLKKELGERDEEDLAPAKALKDLYDCRTCVNHVAQVFCKELMPAVVLNSGMKEQSGQGRRGAGRPDSFHGVTGERVYASERGDLEIAFGMRTPLSRQEAFEILERVFDPDRRRRKKRTGEEPRKEVQKETREVSGEDSGVAARAAAAEDAVRLSPREAKHFAEKHPGAKRVDVRTRAEYEAARSKDMINVPLMELLENPEKMGWDREQFILLGCDGGYRSAIAAQRLAQAGYRHVFFYGWAE